MSRSSPAPVYDAMKDIPPEGQKYLEKIREKVPPGAAAIPYKYWPRDYQLNLWSYMEKKQAGKRALAIWHRRSGKTKTLLNICVTEMFERVGMYFHCFPEYGQGRKIVWEGRDDNGMAFLDHFPPWALAGQPNNTEMKVEFKNGSIYRIVGADNFDSVIGPNPLGIILDEYSLSDRYPIAWDYWRPILAQNGGWMIASFTPRGRNHGFKMYQMALTNPKWFCEVLTVDDTHAISLEAIDDERKAGMSEKMIQQEFYCNFSESLTQALIPWEYIEAAIKRPAYHSGGRRIAGIDIGRFGDDPSVMLVRQGGRIVYAEEWNKMDTVLTAGRIRERYNEGRFDVAAIDVTGGLGAGPYDMCSSWNLPVVGVNATESSSTKEEFFNMRAELGWLVREWFMEKTCSLDGIPTKNKIVEECQEIRYKYSPSGLKQIESKDEIKKPERLGRSCNYFDSLGLTFYPVPFPDRDAQRQEYADRD